MGSRSATGRNFEGDELVGMVGISRDRAIKAAHRVCVWETPNAKRLYESAGFVAWGLEPDCIRVEGEPAGQYHLSKLL